MAKGALSRFRSNKRKPHRSKPTNPLIRTNPDRANPHQNSTSQRSKQNTNPTFALQFTADFSRTRRQFFRARRLAGHALWRNNQRARGKSAKNRPQIQPHPCLITLEIILRPIPFGLSQIPSATFCLLGRDDSLHIIRQLRVSPTFSASRQINQHIPLATLFGVR
jgi:hypothetical protein